MLVGCAFIRTCVVFGRTIIYISHRRPGVVNLDLCEESVNISAFFVGEKYLPNLIIQCSAHALVCISVPTISMNKTNIVRK